ncbi:MAG: class I SAM-dependent methyltransferase [Polyangiales bacterium]
MAETHAPHDDGLEWAFTAPGREGVPAIQLAHNEGKTLALLIQLSRAKKVVEVGTLVGYSGIWIARALPPGGHLWTLELDPKHAAIARKNFERAGVADRVTVVEGPASESLAGLSSEGPFDAVFIDADKGRYPEYGAWATKHLREAG